MPIGGAIVKRAGAPGVLIKTVRWMDTLHADAVWFSLNVFDPTPESAKKAAEAEARRTAWTRFERLLQRRGRSEAGRPRRRISGRSESPTGWQHGLPAGDGEGVRRLVVASGDTP